jgi:hypothetical protein
MNPVKPETQAATQGATPSARNTLTVTDNRTGKTYDLPVTHDTIRAIDLRQIKVKPDDFGMMSYDPAFNNTALCQSKITYIDGDKGILRYRGYSIEELAEKSTYLETAYLILYGELPNRAQHAPHVHPRVGQEIPGRIPLRRPPDGHDDFRHRGAFDVLSRGEEYFQPGIAP